MSHALNESNVATTPAFAVDPDAIGRLTLRLAAGALMLVHGVSKLVTGYEHIGDHLAASGLPTVLRHGVLVNEIVIPLLLIAGYRTRLAAAILVAHMLAAIALVHRGSLLSLNDHHGWAIELNALFVALGLALIFLGGGRYALSADRQTSKAGEAP